MAEITVQRSYKVRINDHDLARAAAQWEHRIPLQKLFDACTRHIKEGLKGPQQGILYLVRDDSNNSIYWTVLETVSWRDPDLKILESVMYLVEEVGVRAK